MSEWELHFTWLDGSWAPAVLAGGALAVSLLAYGPVLCKRDLRLRVLPLVALRAIAAAIAILLVLRPVVRYEVVSRRDARIAVLVDTSASMGVADSVGGETRLASAWRIATGVALERLGRALRIERYTFSGEGTRRPWPPDSSGSKLEPTALPPLAAAAIPTSLQSAWRDLPDTGEALEGILLLSDGRDWSPGAPERPGEGEGEARAPPAPMRCVVLGSDGEVADARWAGVSSERKVLRGSRVRVDLALECRALAPSEASIVVRNGERVVARRRARLRPGRNELALDLVPREAGPQLYELDLEPVAGERLSENNRAWLRLDVSDRPLRVLIREGRMRWQTRYVRRALASDAGASVSELIALGGGRVLRRGAPGRGAGLEIPTRPGGLDDFDVVILGDVRIDELAAGVQEALIGWVESRGGGLVFALGPDTIATAARSALGALLPLDPGDGTRRAGAQRVVPLTAGAVHPITRGLFSLERVARGEELPELEEVFHCGAPRVGAEVLLGVLPSRRPSGRGEPGVEAGGRAGRLVSPGGLLAVRQFGRGRVVEWLSASDWRWAATDSGGKRGRLFTRLWRRIARWVARREAGRAGELTLAREALRVGETQTISIPEPGDTTASTAIEVSGPGGGVVRLELEAGPDGPAARFRPREAGLYRVRRQGEQKGAAGDGLFVALADRRELEDVRPDRERLGRLADSSGGRLYTLAECGRLAEDWLRDRPDLVSEGELGLDRSWWLFSILVGALGLEWVLRRRLWVV